MIFILYMYVKHNTLTLTTTLGQLRLRPGAQIPNGQNNP